MDVFFDEIIASDKRVWRIRVGRGCDHLSFLKKLAKHFSQAGCDVRYDARMKSSSRPPEYKTHRDIKMTAETVFLTDVMEDIHQVKLQPEELIAGYGRLIEISVVDKDKEWPFHVDENDEIRKTFIEYRSDAKTSVVDLAQTSAPACMIPKHTFHSGGIIKVRCCLFFFLLLICFV